MNTYALTKETEAAARLKERIIEHFGEDNQLIADSLEGQTSLHWLIGRAVEELALVVGMVEGIAGSIRRLEVRKERFERQEEALRAAISTALEVAELKSLKLPIATLTMSKNNPGVNIYDEDALPAQYLVPQAPRPDRNAIKAALKDFDARIVDS